MNRNITNMITSIISTSLIIIFIPLIIIFSKSSLDIIFLSISYIFLLVYFLLKSIYYGTNNNILKRIFRPFLDISILLILINYLLLLDNNYKWILFGIICILTIINIFFNIFDCLNITKLIIYGIDITIFTCILFILFKCDLIILISFISLLLFYICNIIGNKLNNKLLLSCDIISIILFSLFLIFK